jgi:hypothetical protein
MEKQFLDYEGLQELVAKIKEKYATIKAFIFKGTVANIAALPAIADQKPGYVYNVTKGGTTTADFDIGAGHPLRDGDNVVAINNGTDAVPIMKWDILGATFVIEDRLQFGDTFPSDPENDQTFLYMGDTTYTYTNVSDTLTPSDNPSTASYFEYDEVNNEYNPSADLYVDESKTYYTIASDTPTSDPQAEGFYELDGTKYVASTDTTVDSGKTYYKASIATVVRGDNPKTMGLYETDGTDYSLTNDEYVVSGKNYFTRAEQYVTGVIYKYNTASTSWVPQTAGDTYIPITKSQIDSLFE